MATIVLRNVKGSPLTNVELDANFSNLNNDKVEKSTLVSTGDGLVGGGDLSTNRTLALATSGVTAGSYGANNSIPAFTLDSYGRVTAASTITPSGTWAISVTGNAGTASSVGWAGVTGKPTTLSGYGITDGQTTLVSGTSIKTVNGQSVLGSGNIQIIFEVYSSKTISSNTTLAADTEYETGRNLRINHGVNLAVPASTKLIVRKYAAGSSL